MIPIFAVVRFVTKTGRKPHLWVPLFLIWLLLAPLVIVLLPFAFIACLVMQINPFRAFAAVCQFLSAMSGTRIEIDSRRTSFLIHII